MAAEDPVARFLRVVDESVLPDSDRYTLEEVAARSGVDPDLTRRLWRALGFADPGPADRIGGDLDVEVLRLVMDQTLTPDGLHTLVRQTRIMSAAIARIADLWVDQIRMSLDSGDPQLLDDAAQLAADQDRAMLLLGYVHRRLLAVALRRELASRSAGTPATAWTVAFADLVGYTTLTERLGPLELAELIGGFEGIAYDTVAEHGGRVVKTIGDEVLFAAEEPERAVDAATELLVRARDAGLPPLRVGADHGPVVWFEGDLFGPTVNRAARLVPEAAPGSVLAGDGLRSATTGRDWGATVDLDLRGVGRVAAAALTVC